MDYLFNVHTHTIKSVMVKGKIDMILVTMNLTKCIVVFILILCFRASYYKSNETPT